ncbi:MAG: tetratricopeptide repeat protein [Gemmatimonadetes bacterium]|nr:tetratricopeptide repeat protein [Gemmatimonadota bacterium]
MSKRHPGSRRVRHTHSQDPDTVFVEKASAVVGWIRSHQNLATAAVIVLAVAVAGVFYFRDQERQVTALARDELALAHSLLAQADEEGAKASLVSLLENFGGTAHAPEARLVLGELYLNSDDSEQAVVVLDPVGRSPSSPIELQAAALLAAALEQENEPDEAETLYLEIADRAELAYQKRDAFAAAARLRVGRGDLAGAAALYEEILASFEDNDPDRGRYVMRLEGLRTAMGN